MKYCISLLWLTVGATQCLPQTSIQRPQNLVFSTDEFKLLIKPKKFALQFESNGKSRQIPIPREWLVPPEEEEAEIGNYVLSFGYDAPITSFGIGNGRICLHLSSYDLARDGTSHAAAGRDVFLLFNPESLALTKGGIERGVTKWRVRSEGCLSAAAEHYLLADVNGDGLIDVGVIKERIECVEKYNKEEDKEWREPYYEQEPAAWYIFAGNGWRLEPNYAGKIPESFLELPLIGTAAADVNDLPLGLWRNFDPSKWVAPNGRPPAYIPPYWKNQIHKHAAAAPQGLEPTKQRLATLHQ
jgi:hypothetical protein